MRAVSSTYASPSLSVCVPVGLVILNALYFVATNQRIVYRIAVQMTGRYNFLVPHLRFSAGWLSCIFWRVVHILF